jgi:hypothetical protein
MDDDYLLQQQKKFEAAADSYRKEANAVFQELSKQLILVATVIITFSSPIFTSETFLKALSHRSKLVLIGAWLALALSLVFGILQFFVDSKYFEKWVVANFKIAKSIYLNEIKTSKELGKHVVSAQEGIPDKSETYPLYCQIFLLVMGLAMFFIFILAVLF